MKWNIELYSKPNEEIVYNFIQSQPVKMKAKIEREIDLLEEFGTDLGYPHIDKVRGHDYKKLWNLRIKQGSNITRIIYFLHIDNKFVLLHGFVKKTDEIPDSELQIAKKNERLFREKLITFA